MYKCVIRVMKAFGGYSGFDEWNMLNFGEAMEINLCFYAVLPWSPAETVSGSSIPTRAKHVPDPTLPRSSPTSGSMV